MSNVVENENESVMNEQPIKDVVEPEFEFEAPQFCDFFDDGVQDGDDDWFDKKQEELREEGARPKIGGNAPRAFFSSRDGDGEVSARVPKGPRTLQKNARKPPPKLTVPKSPNFSSRLRKKRRVSPEEKQKPAQSRRRDATPKLTVPKSPKLRTSSRKRRSSSVENRAKRSRSRASPATKRDDGTAPKLTVPKSPRLSSRTKRRRSSCPQATSEELELEQMKKEQQVLKQRRRENAVKVRQVLQSVGQVLPARSTKPLTEPQEFRFSSRKRSRSARPLTREEREKAEMATMPKWRARQLDKRVLTSRGDLGVPKVTKSDPTEIREFHLRTDERSSKRPKAEVETVETPKFKARPVPKHDPKPVSSTAEPRQLTKPQPFKLRSTELSQRARDRFEKQQEQEAMEQAEKARFHARPAPKPASPSPLIKADQVSTQPQPFNLRSVELSERARERLRKQQEQEENEQAMKANFHAQPLPISDPFVVKASDRELTEPQPFKLKSLELSKRARKRLRKQHEQEENEHAMKAKFQAQPLPISDPFVVKKSQKPLTEIKSFGLASDRRAARRKQFDEEQQRKAEELAKMREEAVKEREAAEREEIKKLRKTLVHKALPMRKTKPPSIKKSDAPLTEPVSPRLLTVKRRRTTIGAENQPPPTTVA